MLDARHRRWVIVLTSLGSLMAAIDTLVVSTAIPTIRATSTRRCRSSSGRSTPTT